MDWKQDGGVLIETLWNVNEKARHYTGLCKIVLIETLWNVNEGRQDEEHICNKY